MVGRLAIGLAGVVGALAGCGGGVDCNFTACGGEVAGDWELEGVCATFDALEQQLREECPGVTVSANINGGGTLSFDQDGTYTAELTMVTTATITIPGSCVQGQYESCAAGSSDEVTCSGNIEVSCRCRIEDTDAQSNTGTWSANGNTLLLDGSDATYCVDGDSLKIEPVRDDTEDPYTLMVLSRL